MASAPANESVVAEVHRMASVGRMLAAVVHELNTPIASLLSNSQTALRSIELLKDLVAGGRDPARAMAVLDNLASLAAVDELACERVAAVVRSLRPFSRAGGVRCQTRIHDLLDDALKLVEWTYRRRIAVQRDFGEIPEIECLPEALRQVFLNLLVNAGQAIEGEGVVTVRTRAEGDCIHIAISDTGKGIRPEDRPRIFSRGFTTKPAGEGTGLGLALARDIVTGAHGGSIDFESQPGAGATFHVRLPIAYNRHAD
ncbi:MAG: hypothetical protein LAQ30_21220 [Acidobacteriia bacterium]|nr:hypothetical protein [Terriglobia bacterium]